MKWTALDGGLLGFDRDRGLNVLHAGDHTAAARRRAPRSLQIGLLTPCNLSCSFCYRDRKAPSRLDRRFLVELLQQCARWGVLEVAFGGGEPLLFDGFAELVEELHATTSLGINVTTNGMLLTSELAERLRGKVGEWRLSVYPDNDWQGTLARLAAGSSIGVNWIVTPANVHDVRDRVRDFRARGARNVLLLGYKGPDPRMILDGAGLSVLRAQLGELDDERIRLDICWHPQLADLPHLFPRTDCGAGDDILVITADRAVQACSFADHRIPFESFEQLPMIYQMMRLARPPAHTPGCTRQLFSPRPGARVVSGRVLEGQGTWAWRARASSNSGAYTILARFRTEDAAREAEAALDDAYQAHLDYISNEENQERGDYYAPTPPLTALATAHGFDWPADDGFAWEGDWGGDREEADQLEIERLGKQLVVHIGYGQQIGARGIERLCAALGAQKFVRENAPYRVVATAPTAKLANAALRAIEELDDIEIGEEEDYDSCSYRVEIVHGDDRRLLGFPDTIGGVNDAARIVLALARVKGLAFELEGGVRPNAPADEENDDAPGGGGDDAPNDTETDPDEALLSSLPLTFEDAAKERFWEISMRENADAIEILTRFGKIGAKGQTRLKSFSTRTEAAADVARQIAEKRKQGFVEA